MKHIEVTVNGKDYRIFPSGNKFDLSRIGESKVGKETETNMGYHMALSTVIDRIAKDSLSSADEVLTLKQYVERYEASLNEVKDLINEIEF